MMVGEDMIVPGYHNTKGLDRNLAASLAVGLMTDVLADEVRKTKEEKQTKLEAQQRKSFDLLKAEYTRLVRQAIAGEKQQGRSEE